MPQSGQPLVSVLIPARNEEKNINKILGDLLSQSYKNIEVIVFNDLSTDKTRELILDFVSKDKRFKLVDSNGLEEGWLGKNFGCYNLAKHAKGEYLLFLDADVRIKSGIIESTLAKVQKHKLQLLSIFPKQTMLSLGEKFSVPVMNMILLSLLPMILTRVSKRPSLAAANGQFMLFEKETYLSVKPHEKAKNNKVEDIIIARMYKSLGLKMQCLTGNETITCRMYNNYKEAVDGFTKNVAEFFGGSHIVTLLYWVFGTFGIFVVGIALPWFWLLATLFLLIGIKIFVSVTSRQNIFNNLLFAIPQQLTLGWIIFLSLRNKRKKDYTWKERKIG